MDVDAGTGGAGGLAADVEGKFDVGVVVDVGRLDQYILDRILLILQLLLRSLLIITIAITTIYH